MLRCVLSVALACVPCSCGAPDASAPSERTDRPAISEAQAERWGALALACVHKEYPNKVAHVLASDADAMPPRRLTPAFYGCFDWHSAVHGHWMLARLAQRFPGSALEASVRDALAVSLTPNAIAGEVAYASRPDREGFERPYGLAWLLLLAAELRDWDDPQAQAWARTLAPLERLAVERFSMWVPKLAHPIRVGEHSQSAFAFGLALDYADATGDSAFASLLREHAVRLHSDDAGCSLALEPSGHDFLSPCLASADLMRRVLPPDAFARWLDAALPGLPRDGSSAFLRPATPADRSDGKLVHLDGLNLSRAWMLEGIAAGLPGADTRRGSLLACARAHEDAGLAAVSDEHYAGSHWLGTYAVYLATARGLPRARTAG